MSILQDFPPTEAEMEAWRKLSSVTRPRSTDLYYILKALLENPTGPFEQDSAREIIGRIDHAVTRQETGTD